VPPSAQPGCRWIMLVASATVGFGVLAWGALGFLPDGRAERFAERLGRLPRGGGAAAQVWRAVWVYRRRQVLVVVSLLLSMVGFTGFVLVYYFSVLTLFDAADVPAWTVHFVIVPIGLLIAAVPLLPGGVGLSELGFGGLYKLVGFTSPPGVLGSLAQRVINWSVALVA